MTTPPNQATTKMRTTTTTHGMAQLQWQFPPPPPYFYSPPSTLAIACRPSTHHHNGPPPPQRKNRHGTTSEKQKLAKALHDFKVYKRALGTTLFCAIFYIFYLLLTLLFFRQREIVMCVAILSSLLLLAVAGVFSKNGACLVPMFVLYLVLFSVYLLVFNTSIFALLAGLPQSWSELSLLPPQLIVDIESIGDSFVLKPTQMALLIAIVSLVCCFTSGYIATEVLTAILCMPKYCQELHQKALHMLGSTTDLSDPALIAHLRKHINNREKRQQRQIRV